MARVVPLLDVSDGASAVRFYERAFGAEELWRVGDGAHIVAGLEVGGAPFFVADESPDHGHRSPDRPGHTTVRVELFVDDPVQTQRAAVAAGGTDVAPVREITYDTTGRAPIRRIIQGTVRDPFGHIWLIGKVVE